MRGSAFLLCSVTWDVTSGFIEQLDELVNVALCEVGVSHGHADVRMPSHF